MDERMNQHMIQTIYELRTSLPHNQNTIPFSEALRLAAAETSPLYLLIVFCGCLLFSTMFCSFFSMPSLTVFCASPLPMLLLYHAFMLRENEQLRELEETFCFSYSEMILARATIIYAYSGGFLLSLSLFLSRAAGMQFVWLSLCGAVPSLLICALMILAVGKCRNMEQLSLTAITLWAALGFLAMLLPAERLLQMCTTTLLFALTLIGLLLNVLCLLYTKERIANHAWFFV